MNWPMGLEATVNRITTDQKGNRTVESTHQIIGCAFWPNVGKETVAPDQDVLSFGATLICPPGSDILSTDEVVANGTTYRVDGEPSLFQSPFTGFQSGIQVPLVSTDG